MIVEESIGQPRSVDTDLDTFFDSIKTGSRRVRFQAMAEGMLAVNRPICILETGCMRKPKGNEGPEGDGCSSLVWDYVANRTQGGFISIDVNPENVEYAKSRLGPRSQVFCSESVKFLSAISFLSQKVDLLYLDSMDYEGSKIRKAYSALHHAAELAAVWPWLAPGCLIAVDDCHSEYDGKHVMVKQFFDCLGIEPIVGDYIHVWRKPEF